MVNTYEVARAVDQSSRDYSILSFDAYLHLCLPTSLARAVSGSALTGTEAAGRSCARRTHGV
jgi:hypothetical protein